MAVKLSVDDEVSTPTVPEWKVELVSVGNGEVDIEVRNEEDSWSLIRLKNDGTFCLHTFIGAESGFKVTKTGRLIESDTE
jgi:hypothetical protein